MSEGILRCIADRYTDIKESGFEKRKEEDCFGKQGLIFVEVLGSAMSEIQHQKEE